MFCPRFAKVKTIYDCADAINKPHEDYPLRVNKTVETLISFIEAYKESIDKEEFSISSFDARAIHSFIMHDLPSKGAYRQCNVAVGNDIPPNFFQVPELIEQIFPVNKDKVLEEWYRLFQTIHPFEDGNGRTGGVIYTVMKFIQTNGEFWAPSQ